MFPLLLRPIRRFRPRFFPVRVLPQANYTNSIGGSGDDIIIIGNGTPGPAGPPGPVGPEGPVGPQGPAGSVGLVPVTIVTTTPYNVLLTDYTVEVNVAGPSSIVLPVAPIGTVFIIKDISGDASTNPITITASTTIDGAASALINTDYGSVTLIFNGIEWNIV